MATRTPKRRRRAPKSLANADHVAAFKAWLTACGAELRDPTNPYEVVRFRGSTGTSVAYRCERTRQNSMTGQAVEAWETFKAGGTMDLRGVERIAPPEPMSDDEVLALAYRAPITIASIMERERRTMREVSPRLFALERDGRLVRSGGGPGECYRWRAA